MIYCKYLSARLAPDTIYSENNKPAKQCEKVQDLCRTVSPRGILMSTAQASNDVDVYQRESLRYWNNRYF